MVTMTEWWTYRQIQSLYQVVQQKAQLERFATTGFGQTDISLLSMHCLCWRLAWVVLLSLHFSSNQWRNWVTLSDRLSLDYYISILIIASSLDMRSEISTSFHFSFSFSSNVDFLKVNWRSCSFWKRKGKNWVCITEQHCYVWTGEYNYSL